jgi:futalosine nucleosidase
VRLRERAHRLGRVSAVLVVTSVTAEREAIEAGLAEARPGPAVRIVTVDAGVGVANAAATTAAVLAERPYAAVLSVGIAGGLGVPAGGLVLGTASVAADLGADSPDGFLSLDDLGLGSSTLECDPDLTDRLATRLPDAVRGTILTVSTVTGTAARADWLRTRHPGAVAEAMEGFGVATAAARAGVPFAEVRAISNAVGPRDRQAWRIDDALTALRRVGGALATLRR